MKKSSVRIVLDANILVSAIFGGIPSRAVTKAMEEGNVFLSSQTLKELLTLGHRLGKKLSLHQMISWNKLYLPLITQMHVFEVKNKVQLCRDPKDDAYLSLAMEASADFLVTGDKDLLSVSSKILEQHGLDHLLIVNPRDFLTRFDSKKTILE